MKLKSNGECGEAEQKPMDARTRFAFLALILTQAAHSVEEYVFRLYDVFAPARFVSGLVSDNHAAGFAVHIAKPVDPDELLRVVRRLTA